MIIDCVLKSWQKTKGSPDSKYYPIPIYQIHHYESDPKYDVKWALQIIAIGEDGEEIGVLSESVFKPEEGSIHYVHFLHVCYAYDTSQKIIYNTQTRMVI